jgi:3-methyladenine DNA glycosylase AlkD
MESLATILSRLEKIEHGFRHIVEAGDELFKNSEADHFELGRQLLLDARYQARMLGTYMLGKLAADNKSALAVLKTEVSKDENWRVQEMLAKAFDHYAKTVGYEDSLTELKEWLNDPEPNVVRAVIEGLRIWTSRPYFNQHPDEAIKLISQHKAAESEYVRKSTGNALRDISRKHAELVKNELSGWDLKDKNTAYTYRLATKNE